VFVCSRAAGSYTVVRENARHKMHFANCAAITAVLFIYTSTENLRLCSSAEAGLFLTFEQK